MHVWKDYTSHIVPKTANRQPVAFHYYKNVVRQPRILFRLCLLKFLEPNTIYLMESVGLMWFCKNTRFSFCYHFTFSVSAEVKLTVVNLRK